MCVLNLGRDVSVVEVTIGPGDRSAAVSLHGVIKFVVVVKFNPVAQLVDDDRIDLNRGAFHQVIGEVDMFTFIVEASEGFVSVRDAALRVAEPDTLRQLLQPLGEVLLGGHLHQAQAVADDRFVRDALLEAGRAGHDQRVAGVCFAVAELLSATALDAELKEGIIAL